MAYIVVGLGNPGKEYARTRHNVGMIAVEAFRMLESFEEFEDRKKYHAAVSDGHIGKEKVLLLLPQTFMNKSGVAVTAAVKGKQAAKRLVIVHDDLDMPLGAFKISFGKNSGGHKGVESVIRAIKTKDFVRVRIGVSPATSSGKLKKPKGDKKVMQFIIGKLSKTEEEELRKVMRKISQALHTIVMFGHERAMSQFNK